MSNNQFPTFREWMINRFAYEELADISHHGVDGGWDGLTYYNDTADLYNRYHDEFWEMLFDDCKANGFNSIFELIASFYGADVTSDKEFKNLLVWYSAEKVATELTETESMDDAVYAA